jgi:hypothetical protein
MKTFVEMVTKANQIGASRFIAIDADGKRTTVSKVDGTWRREDRILTRRLAIAAASPHHRRRAAAGAMAPAESVISRSDADVERAAGCPGSKPP